MARDFKPDAAKPAGGGGRGGAKGGMPPMLIGIIIGLLLGILIALGVAVWLNRAHTPFIDKSPPVVALPTFTPRPTSPPAVKNEKSDPDKPRFEFYQILPSDKSVGSKEERPVPGVAPVVKATTPPVEQRSTAKPDFPVAKQNASETVYLQAGAFQNSTDAENLKAKIAFAGFEAIVRSVNLPDKGTLYRVRLGPYKNTEEVNRIKTTLSQNGIGAAVVKADD
ncbi:MAG: SPOR domain-containing protein [Betaproteobacteria bacterium]